MSRRTMLLARPTLGVQCIQPVNLFYHTCLVPHFTARPPRSSMIRSNMGSWLWDAVVLVERVVTWVSQESHRFQYARHRCSVPVAFVDTLLKRRFDAGKGELLVSLRHENRSSILLFLDKGTVARCVPLSTSLWPYLIEAIEWILHRHALHPAEARLCTQCSYL
jgi:hypothetical protein